MFEGSHCLLAELVDDGAVEVPGIVAEEEEMRGWMDG
jgi:hypothetical protein